MCNNHSKHKKIWWNVEYFSSRSRVLKSQTGKFHSHPAESPLGTLFLQLYPQTSFSLLHSFYHFQLLIPIGLRLHQTPAEFSRNSKLRPENLAEKTLHIEHISFAWSILHLLFLSFIPTGRSLRFSLQWILTRKRWPFIFDLKKKQSTFTRGIHLWQTNRCLHRFGQRIPTKDHSTLNNRISGNPGQCHHTFPTFFPSPEFSTSTKISDFSRLKTSGSWSSESFPYPSTSEWEYGEKKRKLLIHSSSKRRARRGRD